MLNYLFKYFVYKENYHYNESYHIKINFDYNFENKALLQEDEI